MDAGSLDKLETDKGSEDCMNCHTVANSDYGATFVNLLMGVAPDCKADLVSASPFVSMADSFYSAPALWDHHPANSQSMGFNSIYDHNNTFDKLGIFNPTGLAPIPHSMSQFPADSAFIERAARFSCFSTGNITDMVNSFGVNQPINPYHQAGMISQDSQKSELNLVSADLSPKMPFEMKNGGAGSDTGNSGGQEEASLVDTGAQSSSAKRNSTKRKRGAQNTEQTRMPMGEDVEDNGKPNSEPPKNGENGKQSSQTSNPPKEEYIHIRARRGQATNSHSLAERARREKISERMKFLQDLVPGCSKVTGKAAMLDEIINYVQSLQQQVEFLSMKLTTLNPRVDFNDHMFAARPSPPTIGFSTGIPVGYQQLHPSQPTVFHPNHPVMSSQLSGISQVYKDRTSQVHNLWDDELHKVVQMGFNSNSSPENQDTNSTPPAKPKVEL